MEPTNTKAAVLFICGQSNAHGQFLPEVQKWFAQQFYRTVRDGYCFE